MVEIEKKPNIGIILISTWKYNKFIDSTIEGIRKYFFPNSNVIIYLNTDSKDGHDADHIIPLEHQPWPFMTLKRFHIFERDYSYPHFKDLDYVFYLDIDVCIQDYIGEIILCDKLIVTRHYYYVGTKGTPDRNPKSKAFIPEESDNVYVAGGFFGGSLRRFVKCGRTIKKNIDSDLENNVIAVWHDESHLNHYVLHNPDLVSIIHESYICTNYNPYNNEKYLWNSKIVPLTDYEKGFDKKENEITEKHLENINHTTI